MFDRMFNRGNHQYSDEEQSGIRGNTASVHELVPVQSLFGNMMLLKDGSYRMIMKVGAVNFDLKSDHEKGLLLATFGELLNTLQVDFPMQVLLHSTHMNTEAYTREYRDRLLDSTLTPEMRDVIEDHVEYFEEQARTNYLLDRSYYVVIPYWDRKATPTGDAGVAQETMPLGGAMSRFLDSSAGEKKQVKSRRDLEKARIQVGNRCNLIAQQLSRLSISAQILDDLATMRLLREMYNPGLAERQRNAQVHSGGSGLIQTRRRADQLDRPAAPTQQLGPGGAY